MVAKANVEVVSPTAFPAVVADEIVHSVRERIEEQSRCTVVLAGGGTPSSIYRLLSRPPRVNDLDWSKVHLFWGDERWVPQNDQHSNYFMVHETLLAGIKIPASNVHAVDTSLPNADAGAAQYEQVIRGFFNSGPSERPVFDLVLLGMGEDGHTASLFPNSPLLDEQNRICRSTPHPEGGQRVSLTPGVLFTAQRVLFMVKGKSKAEVVRRVLEGDEDYHSLPARLYQNATHNVAWFLDSEAAHHLHEPRE